MLGRPTGGGRALGALLVSMAALLVFAAPAGAYLRDLTVQSRTTGVNSGSPKRELVAVTGCPGPVINGAATVGPGLPNVALNRLQPFGGLLTGAAETDSEPGAWSLASRAFCVANTGVTPSASGNPATYLKALGYGTSTSLRNSSGSKSVTARCPAGKTAIGGGGRILSTASEHGFTAMQRVDADTAWRVAAREVDATGARWQVSAVAICADLSTPSTTANYVGNASGPSFGLYQQFSPSTAFNSASPKSVVRTCPAGSFVVGGGAWVLGSGFESPVPADVVITRSSLGAVNSWIAEARETDPTGTAWRLNAYVACAPLNGAP